MATRDSRLLQLLGPVVTRAGCRMVVAHDPPAFHLLLGASDFRARIIDLGPPDSPTFAPDQCAAALRGSAVPVCARPGAPEAASCPMLPGSAPGGLLLLFGTLRSASEPGAPLWARSYRREGVERLCSELSALLPARPGSDEAPRILGDAPAIRAVREQVRRVAAFREVSVLIVGETGTGKELVAEALHGQSFGPAAPFVAVNCAAVPRDLLESELFGHELGSFTGALRRRIGLLESAAGGTVFLDELGQMPAELQPKLLRALETRRFRRIGATDDLTLCARVVTATNRDPRSPRSGIRPDLHYRVAGFTITTPPLREHREDVPLLAQHFLRSFAARHKLSPLRISPAAMQLLLSHDWPGNVRELRAAVEQAVILSRDGELTPDTFSLGPGPRAVTREAPPPAPRTLPPPPARPAETPPGRGAPSVSRGGLRDVERQLILSAWAESKGSVSEAARLLSLPRSTVRSRLKRYGVR